MKKLIIILFLIFLLPICGNSTGTSVNINGSDKLINFQSINSILYIDINELTKLFSNEALYEVSQILLDKESLKFASGSFFVVYDNKIKLRVAQMSLPCIDKNGILQIPWISFINSLQGIGLLNFNFKNNMYYIFTDISQNQNKSKKEKVVIVEPKTNSKDTIIKHKPNPVKPEINKIPIKTKTTKVISEISDSISSPTKYIIPKGLVK